VTSRGLISGFDLWSCGHLRMTVVHLPSAFGTDIFIRCGNINISRNSSWPLSAILDLLESHGTPM